MQLLELVIFAALAGVVLFQLYAVLGRRVGRQPEDAAKPAGQRRVSTERESPRADEAGPTAPLSGIQAIRERDPGFEPTKFLDGARQAYAMVVQAFAAGDRGTLAELTGPSVRRAFEQAIDARAASDRTEALEFLQPPRADMEAAELVGDTARVKVRFLAEVRHRTRDASGEAVDDRRTAETWTFERSVNSRDPNWMLVRVDAAEH